MKYIHKNLKNFAKSEPLMILLIMLCSVFAANVLYFSLGLISHYQEQKRVGDISSYELCVQYKDLYEAKVHCDENYVQIARDYDYLTIGEFKQMLGSLNTDMYRDCSMIYTDIVYDDEFANVEFDGNGMSTKSLTVIPFRFKYDPATEIISNAVANSERNIYGQNLSVEDYIYASKKASIGIGIYNDLFVENKKQTETGYATSYDDTYNFEDNKEIELFGIDYEIIGITENIGIELPLSSIPDDEKLRTFFPDMVMFVYDMPVTNTQYKALCDYIDENYAGKLCVKELDFTYDNSSYYSQLIAIMLFIVVISSVNIAIIFRYILIKRRRKIAVFKLCGCTESKLNCMFVAEAMLPVFSAFFVGTMFYFAALKPIFCDMFVYMNTFYSINNIISAFSLFMLSCVMVLFIFTFSITIRTPISVWKEE